MRTYPTILDHRVLSSLLMLMTFLIIVAPDMAIADTLLNWSQENAKEQKTYLVDGLKLSLISVKKSDEQNLKLTVTSPEGAKITVYGTKDFLPLTATLLVTHLDPSHSKIDVIFGVFTGGAHCCEQIKVLSLIDRRWRVTGLGLWDGDAIPKPQTVSGKIVLVFPDNAFLYTFASYAESGTPLEILRIENGRIIDESVAPDFRALNRENMLENRKLCAQGANGGCAAYVASAARIGMFHQAWSFMLSHYDRHSNWQMVFCDVWKGDKCARHVSFKHFPDALLWFLRDNGYLPPPGHARGKAAARAFTPGTTIP